LIEEVNSVLNGSDFPFTFTRASSFALKFLKEADFPLPEYPKTNIGNPMNNTSLNT